MFGMSVGQGRDAQWRQMGGGRHELKAHCRALAFSQWCYQAAGCEAAT